MGNLREDLRIEDEEPHLVIDVKGVAGVVEDAEATQSEKHALMRQKENNKVYKALSIINAQRNIPPKDRNPKPYRDAIVSNAEQTGLGLMTTWDLFCLKRNADALGWTSDQVKPIFYRAGRIDPIPEHYEFAGNVLRVWTEAFGFIPELPVEDGRRMAIEIEDRMFEFDCSSLKIDGEKVGLAEVGSNCGVSLDCKDVGVKKKQRIFLID